MANDSSPNPLSNSETQKDLKDNSDNRIQGMGTLASLRIKNFRWLFTGTIFTNAAQWIQQVTLSWLVYNITGSGTMLGTINMVRAVSSLCIVPVAGTIIDRTDRGKLLMIINIWLFLITLALGLMLMFGHSYLWALFVFTVLAGLARTFDMNLRQVVVFSLVPRVHTPNAVALIQTGWSLMRSLGPAVGGFLILWFGPGGNFLIQAGAYLLITVTIVQINFPPRKKAVSGESALKNMKEGFRYVARDRVTLTFTLMGFIVPLLVVPIVSILPPIYAEDVFQGGPDTLGILLSAIGVGGFFGGVVTASLGRVERRGLVQLACLLLLSLSLIGFACCKTLWTALVFLAASGFFEMIFVATNQTLLQLSIPDNLRGRVTAVVSLNAMISPLGGIVAGAGSDLFGGPQVITIILSSLAGLIAICVFFFSPTIRNYSMSKAIEVKDGSSSLG